VGFVVHGDLGHGEGSGGVSLDGVVGFFEPVPILTLVIVIIQQLVVLNNSGLNHQFFLLFAHGKLRQRILSVDQHGTVDLKLLIQIGSD